MSAFAPTYYQGRHAIVRPLAAEDVFSLYSRADVAAVLQPYRPWLATGPQDLDAVAERLAALAAYDPPPEIEALVLHRGSATPLGFLCLAAIDRLNAKAEFAAAFFRGRGSRPALEAIHWAIEQSFGPLGLHKLVFYSLPDNRAAQAMLAAIGAQTEGLLREELAGREGGRLDLVRHALLRDAWLRGDARRRLARLVPLTAEAN